MIIHEILRYFPDFNFRKPYLVVPQCTATASFGDKIKRVETKKKKS